MEKIILKAEVRNELGKNPNKHSRREGKIPGVVYKGGKGGTNIMVDKQELWHVMHTDAGENVIITLNISGGDKKVEKTVIVKEIQAEPVHDQVLHVDFQEISLTEKIKVNVPIVVKGTAKGVTDQGGVSAQALWELEVECLPTEIPENIVVKIDDLELGQAIHVKELKLPEGVRAVVDPERIVVSVHMPKAEEEEVKEAVEGEEVAEPEVIKKGKKEEEEEVAAEGEEAAAPKEKE